MEAKTILKYHKKTHPNLMATAKKWFNEFIRLRDTDENGYGICISSGQRLVVPSANSHAGHFISSGSCARLKFDERNVNLQGKSDNYFKSGNEAYYRINLVEKIGEEEVKALEFVAVNKTYFKWERIALIEVIETYKEKVKELKKHKNW